LDKFNIHRHLIAKSDQWIGGAVEPIRMDRPRAEAATLSPHHHEDPALRFVNPSHDARQRPSHPRVFTLRQPSHVRGILAPFKCLSRTARSDSREFEDRHCLRQIACLFFHALRRRGDTWHAM